MLLRPKYLLLPALLLTSLYMLAQAPLTLKKVQWESKPAVHKLDAQYDNESAVVLFDKRRIEFTDVKEELAEYRTLHKLIRVNDDKGIESFNKVYLPVSDNADIVDIMARTILPGGRIIEVDKKNIKDLKEDDRLYKIFALEGLEKGCEVEFYYTYKSNTAYFGREVLQSSIPVLDAQVEIIAPKRLVFETKSYNQLSAAQDTVLGDQRIINLHETAIKGVEDEKYSLYTANLKRLEYKLSYNASRSTTERLFTWNELAKRAYSVYAVYTDKELKRTEDLINSAGFKKLTGEQDIIAAVENYLKKNIATREDIGGDDAENIEKIIKSKIASYRGIIRLYGAIFIKLGVTHEFVLCGSRSDYAVDKTFENWNNCDNQLIYFPKLKKYMAPTAIEMRFPWINPSWGAANGVFCRGTTIGNFTTAIAAIQPIALEDYSQSKNNIEAKLQLNATGDTLIVDSRQLYSGYSAVYYRANFNFTSAETQRQLLKDLIKSGTSSEHIITSKVENEAFEDFKDNKPFILSSTVHASELVQRAGNKILVKIGEVIGQQAEMYQEKPRQFAMDIQYPHVLERTIEFTLPAGYQVKNLNDINISKVHKDNNETTISFESSYTVEGNVVKIHVLEQYRNVYYPLDQYEDFKKIINASADFNKVTLVLEKKD